MKNVLIVTPVGLEPTILGLTSHISTAFAADFRLCTGLYHHHSRCGTYSLYGFQISVSSVLPFQRVHRYSAVHHSMNFFMKAPNRSPMLFQLSYGAMLFCPMYFVAPAGLEPTTNPPRKDGALPIELRG